MEEEISTGYRDNNKGQPKVDIAQFVLQVEKFNCMTEPFAFILYLWDDLRRWHYPVLTVVLWIAFNLACVVLTQAAVFTLAAFLVIVIALICLVQLHTRLLDKFLPSTNIDNDVSDECVDEHSALQTVREFKFSLMQMHDFVGKCNEYLRHFYSLLKWDQTILSLKFHIELCFFLLCLVVFPSRWTCFLLTNWFFLATDNVYIGTKYRFVLFIEYLKGKRSLQSVFDLSSDSPKHNINTDKSNGIETNNEDTGPLTDTDKLTDQVPDDNGDDDDDDDTIDQTVTGEKTGMVARLMELKHRRKIISNECCFECKASFASILKRRYTCCHCGNNFCSKCCSQKVPKSLFGATAPSAQTDTVLVCVVCHKLLQEQNNKDKAS
ncbi:endoplasmic reticulum tubular network formation [Mactra antiquata]